MSLDLLWAGWRSEFVSGAADAAEAVKAGTQRCVFCRILDSPEPDSVIHVLWRHPGGVAAAILNAYPYISGHLMVMPLRHVANVEDLTADEGTAIWTGVTMAVQAVKQAYEPEGLNVGANLGRAAGAGVPGHLHLHVLPRWSGDTNFMTTVAEARVLHEPLSVTHAKLTRAWPTT